jgi:transcriptional regulator with XRE-family HTH domain
MKKFSERLKLLRKQKKKRQTDMAEFLECYIRHYQKIEYGEVNIPSMDLIALADYFDVSLDYLVGRCDNPNSHKK